MTFLSLKSDYMRMIIDVPGVEYSPHAGSLQPGACFGTAWSYSCPEIGVRAAEQLPMAADTPESASEMQKGSVRSHVLEFGYIGVHYLSIRVHLGVSIPLAVIFLFDPLVFG